MGAKEERSEGEQIYILLDKLGSGDDVARRICGLTSARVTHNYTYTAGVI